MSEEKPSTKAGWSAFSVLTALAAIKLGWILYSKRYIDHNAKLNIILDGEQHTFDSPKAGKIHYYVNPRGKGAPILLVHGLHLYAGLHDMLPIFDAFRMATPIYAIDLPGFGRSEKSDRPYRASLYEAAVLELMKEQIGQACHVVCLDNASEFVSMAAVNEPEWFKSIVMINPTGLRMPGASTLKGTDRWEKVKDLFLSWLKVPLWSLPIFDLFASRASVANFYRKRFVYDTPSDLIDLAYTSAHQQGAHFAPSVLLSGKLQVQEVRERYYEKLGVPVLAVYDNDPSKRFDMLPQLVRENRNWKAYRSRTTRGMPHFEKTGELFRVFDVFWKANDQGA